MPEQVYIGLGSNLDEPQQQVTVAIEQLQDIPHTEPRQISSLYRSRPMGPQDQPDYVNAVAMLKTSLDALALLDALQAIEASHDRKRDGQRWGPRTLDLDILLYGDEIINLPRLNVPHPGLHERAFVLYPLYEIKPDLVIPTRGKLSDLLADCPSEGLEKITT